MSEIDLFDKMDLLQWHGHLTEKDFRVALRVRPERMRDWQVWSDDQRGIPCYYVHEKRGRVWLGYLPRESNPARRVSRKYQDPIAAFAAFIKRDFDSLAKHLKRLKAES